MRPVRLKLENFGPYRAPAEVDFEKLGGLFLVHGKTGSGKTTLFDAMTYALYGKAPGARSSLESQLASHWAEPGEASSVSFEFIVGGRRYLAERNPPSRRVKRNGEMDLTPPSATLSRFEDGGWKPIASKVSEAGAAAAGLLGLSADEFSKVVLLPQGEFQRFLEMGSKDRTAVLEKLFPVDLHETTTSLAREKAKAAEEAAGLVGAALARIAAEEPEEGAEEALATLRGRLEQAEIGRQAAAAEATLLALALEAARAKSEALKRASDARTRLEALEAASAEMDALATRLQAARRAAEAAPEIAEARRSAEESAAAEARLAGLRDEALAVQSNEDAIAERLAESARLVERIAVIDGDMGSIAAALEAWDRAAHLSERRLMSERRLKAAQAQAESRGHALVSAEDRLATLAVPDGEDERRQSASEAARAAYEAARDAKLRADALEADRVALGRAVEALAKAEAERSESRDRLAGLDARIQEAVALRDASAAALLAAGLSSGSPCPVCGSTDHPAPARPLETTTIDSASFRVLEAERRVAMERHSRAAAELDSLKAAVERGRAALEEREGLDPAAARAAFEAAGRDDEAAAASLRELASLRRRRDEASVSVEAARSELKAANDNLAVERETYARLDAEAAENAKAAGTLDPRPRLEALRKERADAESRRAGLEAERVAHIEKRSRVASAIEETLARTEALRQQAVRAAERRDAALERCGFDGETAVLEAFLPPEGILALEKRRSAWDRDLAAARAALEEALRSAQGPIPDSDEIAVRLRDAEERRVAAELARDAARDEVFRLRALVDDRARLEAERQDLDARHARLSSLSQLLSGTINQRRLPFKNFALGAWFRAVVDRANLRLREMSGGRYSLAVEDQGGRGFGGLDLAVRDAYTGTSRATGTLSGGERFLASVSLALGLADAIRERSGGAALEAVFIDEGFGSLDEEALDRAIAALESIRGARMIGIVSHVAALRSRVPSRIEVLREREGSRIVLAEGLEEE
ncbi:MAG: AAA family ATPase [Spirochaetales bacterium]|nr:AAA family ATPase [Spirochaetales bacterium]